MYWISLGLLPQPVVVPILPCSLVLSVDHWTGVRCLPTVRRLTRTCSSVSLRVVIATPPLTALRTFDNLISVARSLFVFLGVGFGVTHFMT